MTPRFFAPDADAGDTTVTLASDESHHLAHVLRLEAGAAVRVFNGRGQEWAARVAGGAARGVDVELLQPVTPAGEPPVRLTLAVAVLKGDQMDNVIRDATMMGIAAIVPMASSHVAVPARAWQSGRAVERWRRVAIASVKQCGRAVVPDIAAVHAFADVMTSAHAELTLMAVEPAAGVTLEPLPDRVPASALALVGPEGGWSQEEVERAIAGGAVPVSLGPRTLRAETAPIVLVSSLWTRWGW
jgi:16S rRNA (uracil1498-N3)-methyltransferase